MMKGLAPTKSYRVSALHPRTSQAQTVLKAWAGSHGLEEVAVSHGNSWEYHHAEVGTMAESSWICLPPAVTSTC
jgi:hypothetical protein